MILEQNCYISSIHFRTNLCISKYQFKYNDVTKIGDVLFITCLICNQKFYKTTVTAMKIHHDKCKELQTLANMQPRIQPKTIATGSNTNDVNTSMPSCSTNPNPNRFVLSTRNQNVGTTPQTIVTLTPKNTRVNAVTISLDKYQYNLKTVKRVHDNKDVKCAQCRICNKYFGMELLLLHR